MPTRILIQARMGSSRLPGKVLKPLAGKPQLQHLLDRLSPYRDELIVVTSEEARDAAIEQFCKERNVACFRGSESDVLDRFYKAGKAAGLNAEDTMLRVTADCPLHHAGVVTFALAEFRKHTLDYFSNSFAPHYEDGCDTEVFRFGALETAWKEARLQSQREHVTPFIKDSGLFLCGYKKFDPRFKFKLSVDTPEDHAAVEAIIRSFAPREDFGIREIVDLVLARPELLEANKDSVINAGYKKSLEEDKEVQ